MATSDSVPHDYVDAELTIEGLASPTDERTLLKAIEGREGIASASLSGDKLILEYEPVYIHKTQIVALIQQAGFRVGEIESALASPIDDAIYEEGTPPPVAPPAEPRKADPDE